MKKLRVRPVSSLGAFAIGLCGLGIGACSGGVDEGENLSSAESAIVTYQVGPTRAYKTLSAVASKLQPGDVVEVDGNATYAGGISLQAAGTPSSKITIRGVRVNGKRPVLSGGSTNTIELAGNNTILEGFDITGGAVRCVFHHADGITIRDTVIHDCPSHGLLGADSDSGSLTMQYVEVYKSGSADRRHPVYMATDEEAYPNAVFRMEHCYLHDNVGGNSVKSRASRNEIYYNWIEGGLYKELELIGPDGADESLKREDSDVVGNVFRKVTNQFAVRIGGDGTGQTWGRYRFANNTFITAGTSAAIHLFDGIESVELVNNAFYRAGGGAVTVFRDDAAWATGSARITGRNNWVTQGSSIPSGWSATKTGTDPKFTDNTGRNVTLTSASPLINAGISPSQTAGFEVASALLVQAELPPLGKIEAYGTALKRPVDATLDIGAFEFGSGGGTPPPPPPPEPPPSNPPPPPAPTCQTAQPGNWLNAATSSISGAFAAEWDVTPSLNTLDAAVGLSNGAAAKWSNLAAIVLFSVDGVVKARNGGAYAATNSFAYQAGKTYHVRMVGDVSKHTYSVYVKLAGGTETLVASNFAFRTEQASVASLNNAAVHQEAAAGSLQACGFTVK